MDSIKKIPLLDWTNFPLWKEKFQLALLIFNCDHVIRDHAPTVVLLGE